MSPDEKIMAECISLAKKGAGYVSPNPLVGAVIVKNGKIIGRGYHKKYGLPHAEKEAIKDARKRHKNLSGSTMYVNLEPCCHYGKTPPCTDAIIKNGIKKVVIGIRDPYKKVADKGIKTLKDAGINVTENVLKDDCEVLNKFFFKSITTGLPYVMLKIAQTLDGKIADKNFVSKWITGIESRKQVHKMRSEYDAVLIGSSTLKYDNPSLTVRHVKGRNPFRIILNPEPDLVNKRKVFIDRYSNKTIIFSSYDNKFFKNSGVTVFRMPKLKNGFDLESVLRKLSLLGITSVMVEGGGYTYTKFLESALVDEIIMFVAPKIMGEGIEAIQTKKKTKLKVKDFTCENSGEDILLKLQIGY